MRKISQLRNLKYIGQIRSNMSDLTVTGLTIIKNVTLHNYPIRYAYDTIEPVLDELIIVVGNSSDNTMEIATDMAEKHGNARIIKVSWPDGNPRVLGKVTNIGLRKCKGNWIYYFQADEFADRNKLDLIRDALKHETNSYLFPFVHFYGDIRHLQKYPTYKYAIRLFKNKKFGVSSDLDAWSFTGFKIYKSLQINRIFPTSYLDFPIYHSHNIGANASRGIARGDVYAGRTIEYDGFVPQELLRFYNTLL